MASWMRFKNEKEKINEILRLIEVFTFRVYVIGRRRADTGEALADRLAFDIHNNLAGYEKILEELKTMIAHYEGDLAFQTDLKISDLYEKLARRDLKYLLYEFEKFSREKAKEPIDFELESILVDKFDIEHIWASNTSVVPEGLETEHEENQNKLGNLTLASSAWNRSWKDKPFLEKRNSYADSSFKIQRELSESAEWRQKQIIDRESRLIKFALERWRI
jgi:hypothetical protein